MDSPEYNADGTLKPNKSVKNFIKALPDDPIESHIRGLLECLGLEPDKEEGLKETPKRVAKFYREFVNLSADPVELLKTFTIPTRGEKSPMVVQTGVPFAGLCEHHLLPFQGTASIGYIPKGSVVGLSKLTRLVRCIGTQRPSVQERITDEIADTMVKGLDCLGVIVVATAEHTCMSIRGVKAPGVVTTTSSVRGIYMHVEAARQEFFSIVNGSR